MIKALWFMLKIAAFVAVAVWIAEQPGTVDIHWMGYDAKIKMGFFLFSILCLILLTLFVYNTIKTFVEFPSSYSRYKEVKRFGKGYKALTLGLTAVAAGDTKIAVYQAHRAEKFLENDTGLPLLLKAQSARMQGKDDVARDAFVKMLANDESAFLGVRGLLQMNLDKGEYAQALGVAQKALVIQPKQPWILKIVYDMQIRLKQWAAAQKTLAKMEAHGGIDKPVARKARVALLHARAEEFLQENNKIEAQKSLHEAFKVQPDFVPTLVQLAQSYYHEGNRRKAVKLLEKAWKAEPHPDLARAWMDVMSQDQGKKNLGRMQWFERLLKVRSDTVIAQMEGGRIATQDRLWGEARKYFERAEALSPNALLYQLWASLEEQAGHDATLVDVYLKKAAVAEPVTVWVCRESGRIYEQWQPVAQPHGAFNTISWSIPGMYVGAADANDTAVRLEQGAVGDVVLDAPKKVG